MKIIKAINGIDIKVDDEEYPFLIRFKWSVSDYSGVNNTLRYALAVLHRIKVPMQYLILGTAPSSFIINHIDGDGLNNCRANLEFVSINLNIQKRRTFVPHSSKYRGVTKRSKGCWEAGIKFQGKTIYLGSFKTDTDAAKAYNDAALNQFGESALLNSINQGGTDE